MRRSHLDGYGYGAHLRNHEQHQSTQGSSQVLDQENEEMTQQLSNKIRTLKSLTIDIGHEVREQNKFLKSLDDDFDKGGGFLRSTMSRVTALAKSGQHCHILYLLLFAIFVFFVCWIIIKTR